MTHYIVGLALLATSVAAHWTVTILQQRAVETALRDGEDVNLNIPGTIGPYRQYGEDLDPGDDVREALETSDILMRYYTAPSGMPILVTIVYAGQKRRSLHFPEQCFVGQGWEVEQAYTAPVGIDFEARRPVIFRGDKKEAVLYWMKTGKRFTGSTFVNALYWAGEQLRFGTPTSSMIRLSIPVNRQMGQTEEGAFEILDDFAGRMAPMLLRGGYLD